ncbi:MAG TPA: Type 1 glutamine amidotransferase-like domain-containing protein, partial [Acidimicrobiales bacterium]
MPARQPTIVATSIGFQPGGNPYELRPGPSYRMAADLAGAGAHPRVCVLATATGDDAPRLALMHNALAQLGFVTSHLTLFPMPNVSDVRAHLLAQDVILVGGGSTANLLALWRLHGIDTILRECWEAGVVLQGVSAGSLC